MAFLVASVSLASVLAMVLLFPCTFVDFSICPSRNETPGTVVASRLATAGSLLTQDERSLSRRKRSSRDTMTPSNSRSDGPPTDETTTEGTEETTPHYIKDYEMDYPQIFETIRTSTTRVPSKFPRFPYRGFVDAKCEEKDEGKMFPDPTWCSRYFYCHKGFLNVYVCPELTVFRPQIQGCDHRRSYECSSSILNLDIANWRRLMSNFYMTTDRGRVRDRMMKKVTPMSEVTFPTDPPYIPVYNGDRTHKNTSLKHIVK